MFKPFKRTERGSNAAPRAWHFWLAIPFALSFLGADPAWDSIIERDEAGEPGDWCINNRRGWEGADGAMSARHTSTNRTFFFFGDSFLARGSPYPDISSAMLEVKTVPAHVPPSESSWGSTSEFWGRDKTTTLMKRISADSTNVAAVNGPSPLGQDYFYWVENAIIRPQTNRLITIQSHLKKDGTTMTPRVCSTTINGNPPSAWPNSPPGHTCADLKYQKTPGGPFFAPWADGLVWGKSINYARENGVDWYYIYGTRNNTLYDTDAVLARATGQTIMNYSQWEFLHQSGQWVSPQPLGLLLLSVADDVGNHFNVVEGLTYDLKTRHVMVQGGYSWGAQADFVFVRIGMTVGGAPTRAWHAPTGFASDQNTWVGNIGESYGIDPPCGSSTYGTFGQWDISNQGAGLLKVSYHCQFVDHSVEPWWAGPYGGVTPSDWDQDGNPTPPVCDPNDQNYALAYWRGPFWDTNQQPPPSPPSPGYPLVGRNRFWDVPLAYLRPWCTTNCWMPP